MIIDGKPVTAAPGATVLEAAREAGLFIPALCHHPALPADGSCRLCLVEVDGRRGLQPACTLPAAEGLVVRTDTGGSRALREQLLRLMLARYAPGTGRADNELLSLAARYGVPAP
ncbi:MAG TPA: 2Fe-2S iron-sulfur cluster-binding protein, partial [Methylomirabilota bacterium]|nr:2Fe-2S iron-sulfur cluster-binding protein [Methylomirabilota bacterium]